MENKIKLTRLIDNDNAIAKNISWDGIKLIKNSQASVKDGRVEAIEFETMAGFKDYLTGIPSDECLILGKFKHGQSGNIVAGKEAENPTKNNFSRSLDNFEWHDDYQVLCIDYDGSKAGNLTPEEVITAIDDVMPGFADVTKVVKYSSSAHIYDQNNKLLSPSNGFHIYFMVNHAEKIAEIFKGNSAWLHKKLWLAGYGYIKNSKPSDSRTTAVRQM